jgi:hypothetical protein
MLYKLLGIAVWKGAKALLRTKYGTVMAPKPLLAGGLALAAAGVAVAVLKRGDGE